MHAIQPNSPMACKKSDVFHAKADIAQYRESSKSSHVMGDRENKLGLCPSFFREAACVGSVLSPVALRLVSISQLIETAGHITRKRRQGIRQITNNCSTYYVKEMRGYSGNQIYPELAPSYQSTSLKYWQWLV